MKNIEELLGCMAIAGLYPYYRADVFGAHLIEAGCDMEQIVILRKNGSERGFLHDINRVSIKYPNSNPESPYFEIESGRQGIYDSLPEDLFYCPDNTQRERDKAAVVNRIKADRQAELTARQFLRLFEVEADQVLTFIQTKNIRYDKSYTYRESSDIFNTYWDIISLMRCSEAQRFLKVVPYNSQMRGNLTEISSVISFILNVKCEVKNEYIPTDADILTPILSDIYLGDNSVLHSCKDDIYENSVVLVVSELDLELCQKFFEGQKYNKIAEFLLELFTEVNTPFRIEICPKSKYCHFEFGVSENEPYLAINTYLEK